MHGFSDDDSDLPGNGPENELDSGLGDELVNELVNEPWDESWGLPATDRANDIRDDRWAFIPDVRDGLTRAQRIVLYEIHKAQKESSREFVPTAMLYGRVVEHINISEGELQAILRSLGVTGDV